MQNEIKIELVKVRELKEINIKEIDGRKVVTDKE